MPDTFVAASTTDPFYRAFVTSKALVAAVRNDDLETVRWVYDEYCLHMAPVKAVGEAAAFGKLRILRWFFTRHPGARPNGYVRKKMVEGAYLDVLQCGHLEMVR